MTSIAEIERVVREVLAELMSAGAAPAPRRENGASVREGEAPAEPKAAGSSPAPAARQEPRPPGTTNHELVVTSRVVTLSEVEGRLAGIRRMMVRQGAVITPAVKEELSKRNIQVLTGGAAAETSGGALKVVIVAARTKIDPQPLAAALQSDGVEIELHSSKCVIESTDRLAAEVKRPGTLGVLLTPHEAESLCLANRLPGVRAIAGKEPGEVAANAAAVGANVLVIHPKKVSPFAIRQMLGEFCRGGLRPCPDVFKQRLQ
jgi:hypothetical protein